MTTQPSAEISHKLTQLRQTLTATQTDAIRLKSTDWFAWATAGGSNTVLLAAETGVAEVLITPQTAYILTDEIEAQRLKDEQIPPDFQLQVNPWADPAQRETFLQDITHSGKILSDRPTPTEHPLPPALLHQKRILLPSEIDRYRHIGRLASQAMTAALSQAQPTWTEQQLAGAGAAAMWSRGLHPALTLAAGEQRLPRYRHPLPSDAPLGRIAMLVFCARGFGLYASLTRFVSFGALSPDQAKRHQQVRAVEAVALDRSQPGTPLNTIYSAIDQAYQQQGYPNAIREHHQGGTTGYLAREVVANPHTPDPLTAAVAVAWNPSLPGAKVEDTFLLHASGALENLTFDPNWASVSVAGRDRPIPLER